jgi:hypothetical protein
VFSKTESLQKAPVVSGKKNSCHSDVQHGNSLADKRFRTVQLPDAEVDVSMRKSPGENSALPSRAKRKP